MSWRAAAYAVPGAPPVVVPVAATGIGALCIAGRTIRDVACHLRQGSLEESDPYVFTTLGGLLGQACPFLVHQSSSRRSIVPRTHSGQPVPHTEWTRNLSRGGSQ